MMWPIPNSELLDNKALDPGRRSEFRLLIVGVPATVARTMFCGPVSLIAMED